MGKSILYSIVFLSVFSMFSQQKQAENNVKVGVVLSGGGAKGLAHIGALKVIEESGVQIDYIAGTSMGAIVGGLYASGYSADELTALFKQVNFEELIGDEFQRRDKSFFERNNSDKHALTLPFNKFKIALPSSISKGQNTYNLFVKLLDHVKDVNKFSELSIPFFCMATDLETGQQVQLEEGYLPNAILASGAIPTLFEPVSLDGKLLVDGGISNNYPVDELLEKNVDVVIGVDVQDKLMDKEQLASVSDIMKQVSNFTTNNQMVDKVKKTSFYIKPDISEFSIISFEESDKIYQVGYEAAQLFKSDLRILSEQQSLKPDSKPVGYKGVRPLYTINKVTINGNENYSRAFVLGKLKLKTPSEVSYEKIEKGIIALAATDNFNVVKHKITQDSILNIDLTESHNKTSLKLAVHYDDLYKGAALMNISHKQLITNNDIVSFDFILGQNIRYNFEYYIDKGFYWSIGLKSRLNSFENNINTNIFSNSPTSSAVSEDINVLDLTNQFYLETLFRKDFALGIGVEHKLLKIEGEETDVTYENDNFFSAYAELGYDTLDDIYYPTRGLYFKGDVHQYFFTDKITDIYDPFTIAKAKMGFAAKVLPKWYVNFFSEGGFRLGNNDNSSFDFVLGGYGNNFINNYVPFYGFDFLSIAGDGYVKSDLSLHYQFYKKHFLTAGFNMANVEDGLFNSGNWLSWPNHIGYAIGYGAKTILGPVQIKSTWSPEIKKPQWFVSLGYWF
ncbi:MAG: patatin-like phospholipase family protein [Flavobacteriaceae bacterium]